MEKWKEISGYNGNYLISDQGNIKSIARIIYRKDGTSYRVTERILKHHIGDKGYHQVNLVCNGKNKYPLVHRLVAETFIENPQNKDQVNHIDGNKNNNTVSNLEWVSCSENILHAYRTQLKFPNRATKLSNDQVEYIRKNYRFRDKENNTKTIAKRLGVSAETVARVIRGTTYSYVNSTI